MSLNEDEIISAGGTSSAAVEDVSANLSVLLEAVYRFAGSPEDSDGMFELSDLLTRIEMPGEVPSHDLATHFEQAIAIAEKVGSAMATAPPHTIAPNRLDMDAAGKILEVGTGVPDMLSGFAPPPRPGTSLRFEGEVLHTQFIDALRQCAAGERGGAQILRLGDGAGNTAYFGFLRASTQSPGSFQLSFLAPPDQDGLEAETITRLGLTPAEGRLLREVQAGQGLKDAAAALGIAHNTARNQLKSVFAKLGVKRQAELVRQLTLISLFAAQQSGDSSAPGPKGNEADDPSSLAPALAALHNPVVVDLPGSGTLSYYLLGPAIGRPVLVMPSPTQMFLVSAGHLKALERLNICLVVVLRPGFGNSTAQPDMTFAQFGAAMKALLAALQKRFLAQSFPILSMSSAAPFALAAADAFGEGASALGLVAPRLSADASNRKQPLGDAVLFLHALKAGWALDFAFSVLKTRMNDETVGRVVDRIFKSSPLDAARLKRYPALRQSIITAAQEGFNTDAATLANETRLVRDGYQPDWDNFKPPIAIWQGADDKINPAGGDRASLGNMPIAQLNIVPDCGHLILDGAFDRILAELIALADGKVSGA